MLIKSFNLKILLLLIFSTVSSFTVSAHDDEKYSKKGKAFVNVDSEAAKTVSLFHASLKQGNREAARKLLATMSSFLKAEVLSVLQMNTRNII